ncbi:hypothetical protein [Streptomyces violaceoruber]|uniref:hypothetical protein n=1 Tax=Streptomyces violaceoruber TaxID=1935 RepID=UPI003B434FCE
MTDTSPTPADLLRAAAVRARTVANPVYLAFARLLDGYATDWDCCPADHPGTVLDEHALAVARQLLGTTVAEGAGEVFPDEGPDELRAELAKLIRWHKEDGDQLAKMRGTIEQLRAERAELIRQRDQIALDTIKALPAPADRAAVLREAADRIQRRATQLGAVWLLADQVIDALHRIADEKAEEDRMAADAAAGVQPPTTADPLADCATEYHVPVPEHGGTELLVRRQALAHGAGWAVSTMARGGGRAWTTEGWQDSISALAVARLFCWPDPATAVDAARRALATPAAPEERLACPDHGLDGCEADDHMEPPTVNGEVI